jgi:hypothetical protein
MATSHDSRRLSVVPGFREPEPARVNVYQLYREQMPCLAALPGQVSEFQQNQFGYEWRCEFALDEAQGWRLQFSLVDLQGQQKPAAVLYLLLDQEQRISLSVEELNATHEQLNGELARRGASIEILQKAHEFISALAQVRDTLGDSLSWD